MPSHIKTSNYQITSDPNFQNEKFGLTQDIIDQFEGLHRAAMNPKDKKIIEQLTDLILKHPKSPQLKNYLSVAYHVRGNQAKAQEANKWILSEHPDYLFAKLNLANEYMNGGEPERVPEVLGEEMEIKGLYPERDIFHLAEVTGFYRAAIRYFVAIDRLDLAENRLEVLQDLAPGHPDTNAAVMTIITARMQEDEDDWNFAQDGELEVENAKPHPRSTQRNPPQFTHPEIDNLYLFGPNIPREMLQKILALDRETLIADLEKVVKDAEDRYLFFRGPEGREKEHDAPFHAILLLAELKAERSLPLVLDFLENDEEVLDFYLGDHLTETMWMQIYLLGQNNTEALKQFLLKPGVYTYSKAEVSVAIAQIALHQPHRRDEIESIYREMFQVFLEADVNENLIDSGFLALAIGEVIDCGFSDLLPLIKKLYDKDYISLDMEGDYEDVEKSFRNPANIPDKREVETIFELYDRIVTTWVSYTGRDGAFEDEFDFDDEFDFEEAQQPAVSNKIGRNDPCPCGSGKKYKKCCMDKE